MPSAHSQSEAILPTPAGTQRLEGSTICAKLLTTAADGRKEVLLLNLDCPLVIGRNPAACSYVITDGTVSGIHCKIYAIRSSQGGVMVSLQDLSSNGIYINGARIRKMSLLLMDGDVIQIASRKFECVHVLGSPQRAHFFDPTPRSDEVMKTKQIGKYLLTSHCLGSGSFATVHLGMDSGHPSYKQIACKIIKRKKHQQMDKMMKEVRILTSLNHATINRVYDVHNDETFLYIFLQLCTGGDLFSYIVNHKDPASRLHEGETKYIMYQLVLGLTYLHDKCISHRDLKPENILLYAPGPYPRIQIADFGLARRKSYEETLNVCGTVSYLPPEGILALENKDLGYVGMPADCWSAGVLLYIMLCGHHPFDYGELADENSDCDSQSLVLKSWEAKLSMSYIRNDRRVRKRIVDDDMEFSPEPWDSLEDGLMAFDPQLRWSIQDAFNSDWIQCDLEELSSVYLRRVESEALHQ